MTNFYCKNLSYFKSKIGKKKWILDFLKQLHETYIYINYEYLSIHPTSNPDRNSRLIEYIAVEHLFALKQIYENNKQNTYSKN